jgi:hypothetical protein
LFSRHRLIVIGYLALGEQTVVNCYFADRAFKPCVGRHGADIQGTVVGNSRHLYSLPLPWLMQPVGA